MKTQKVKQFAFVEAYDLDAFEVKLNEKMEDLAVCGPEASFIQDDPAHMIARISFTRQVSVEEQTPAERGVRFTCGDCPLFRNIEKRDGTPDLRRTFGNCNFGEMGRVWKASPACDYLYKMITDGRIRLELDEEEEA